MKRPPDRIPNDAELEDFYWNECWQCGENVCVNMLGMGHCRRCKARLPREDEKRASERLYPRRNQ